MDSNCTLAVEQTLSLCFVLSHCVSFVCSQPAFCLGLRSRRKVMVASLGPKLFVTFVFVAVNEFKGKEAELRCDTVTERSVCSLATWIAF